MFERTSTTGPAPVTTSPSHSGANGSRSRSSGGRLLTILVAVGVIATLAVVAGLIPRWRARVDLESTTRALAVPTVEVVQASAAQAAVPLLLSAELKPYLEASIHPRATGYVKRWMVDLGAKVEEGQLLAEIDTPELHQELARSRAELAQAEAARDLAQTTAVRWAELLRTSSVAEQEAAEKKADLALKVATVEAARSNVRRLEELTGFSQVTSPFAGTVTRRLVNVGDLVTAGTGAELFRMAQTTRLRVFVRVPQTLASDIRTNEVAQLSMPESAGQSVDARVVRMAGVIEPDSRTMLTELEVDNSSGRFLSGSFAQVRFPAVPTRGVALPSNTLLFRAEGTQVATVDAEGKVTLRSIKIGRDLGPTLEVINGVTPQDRVIVNPPDSIASGRMVRVMELPKPAPKP